MLNQAGQDTIVYGYFPPNRWLCGLGQHSTCNFLVQCCLWNIWITLSLQYSYAMLSQVDKHKIVQVLLLRKVVCWPWANNARVKTLCNVAQEIPDNIAQEKILFNIVLILLGRHCTGKSLVQCCPRSPYNIAQEQTQCNVVRITSLFGDFYFEPINFLIMHKFTRHWTGKIPGQHWTKNKIVRNKTMKTLWKRQQIFINSN